MPDRLIVRWRKEGFFETLSCCVPLLLSSAQSNESIDLVPVVSGMCTPELSK